MNSALLRHPPYLRSARKVPSSNRGNPVLFSGTAVYAKAHIRLETLMCLLAYRTDGSRNDECDSKDVGLRMAVLKTTASPD
jgi:hypothetical protein